MGWASVGLQHSIPHAQPRWEHEHTNMQFEFTCAHINIYTQTTDLILFWLLIHIKILYYSMTHISPLRIPWILTFQYDLNEVLGWHLAMSGETLIGSSITLSHTSHDQVLPVLACHANAVAGVDELSVAVPGQLVLLRAGYTAGQWNLASHAALHLSRTHHYLQGLCRIGS